MKLSDIKNIKRHFLQYPLRMKEFFEQEDFTMIGSGDLSSVWSKDSNIVIKINHVYDPCWQKFHEYARHHHRSNPHLPKISRMLTNHVDGVCYFLVFMEKLVPIEHKSFRYNFKQDYDINIVQRKKEYPRLVELVNDLRENIPDICFWDLHPSNLMRRPSDGLPVVIDPWSAK